jgi:two-component system LytT family response regulator
MSDIKVLIADDEPLARRGLEQVLAAHPECTIVGEARNGRETVRALRAMQPDVVFLDIQMPGLNGFQVLEALREEQPPVIVFVTAYDEFAVRAFEAQALDYLLKPVSQERFDQALRRVKEKLHADHALQLTEQLVSLIGSPGEPEVKRPTTRKPTIVVPTATGDLVLDPTEIDWIQAEDYYAAVHALGRRYLIRESLRSLVKRLDPTQFVQVHRSAIVRIDRVRELRQDEQGGCTVVLRDGTHVPVSRRRRERVAALIRRR